VILAIHPDRADLGIAPADAWHFTARQLDLLLVVLSIGVVAFIMVSVVPGIKDMLTGSGAPIPDTARFVIGVSDWLVANGTVLAGVLLAAVLAAALLWQRTALPRLLRDLALRLPGIGTLLMKAEVAQFCRILGALTAAGMTLPASLKLISSTPLNRRILSATRAMETALRRGEDFVAPLVILALSVFVGFIITSLMSAVISINDLAI